MTDRARLADLLGPGFPGADFTSVTQSRARDFHGWLLEDLTFHAKAEDIPAYFLRPPDGHAPAPAILYCHAHGNDYAVGRDELIQGRPALVAPYASDLMAHGCAVLCVEMPCFGARQMPPEPARAKAHLWAGSTLFGQMLAELRAGVSFLANHPAVVSDRIGALGLSMGSTHAFWLAALDPRIRAASALCSFADLAALIETGGHDGHGIYMMVPGLTGAFTTGQIAGLAAPRALQIAVGLKDWSTPPAAFAKAQSDLRAAYDAAGATGRLQFHVEPDLGHAETPAMRRAVLDFLRQELVS
jgi:dienelactone hydrolase